MTNKEALKDINETLKGKVEELNDPYPNVWSETLIVCKEALEKQIPKKVEKGEIGEYMGYYCPVCHEELVQDGQWDYCMFCGQALDWEEEEE